MKIFGNAYVIKAALIIFFLFCVVAMTRIKTTRRLKLVGLQSKTRVFLFVMIITDV